MAPSEAQCPYMLFQQQAAVTCMMHLRFQRPAEAGASSLDLVLGSSLKRAAAALLQHAAHANDLAIWLTDRPAIGHGQAEKVLKACPPLIDIAVEDSAHITVCGDIHGQFYDLLNIFDMNGYPSLDNPYLFNGVGALLAPPPFHLVLCAR